jgi:hypothetical protein
MSSPIVEGLRRLLKKPLVFFALAAASFFLLFPKFGARDILFRHQLPRCAESITVTAYSGAAVARSFKHQLSGQLLLEHAFSLPQADYRLSIELECPENARAEVERTLTLDEDTELDLNLRKECRC